MLSFKIESMIFTFKISFEFAKTSISKFSLNPQDVPGWPKSSNASVKGFRGETTEKLSYSGNLKESKML